MKNKRPPFAAAHNCICVSPDNIPIMEFYKGYFNSVYIILSPFYKKDGADKIIQTIGWNDMLEFSGFKDIKQLDIALRNSILGLNERWKNTKDAEHLQKICETYDLWAPSEGYFPDTLRADMLNSLKEQGHNYMFIADEYGFERKLEYIQDAIEGKDDISLQWGPQRNWYTTRNEILYTTHWDSHFTLLCSDRKTIESILNKHEFEGFFCDEHTEIYWSLSD